MPRVLAVEIVPVGAQVAILDTAWQGYPEWGEGDHWVAFGSAALLDPENPPHPGFAVATRSHVGVRGPATVAVEVWRDEPPPDLRPVHRGVLRVGDHGVVVGNEEPGSGGLTGLDLPRGSYPLQIWVDADRPSKVTRVAFVLGDPGA